MEIALPVLLALAGFCQISVLLFQLEINQCDVLTH